jgi:mannitol/fructose-specific phosphotransferase system IIA component (Ntr-type)
MSGPLNDGMRMKDLLIKMIKLQEFTFAQMEHTAADAHMGLKEIRSSLDQIFGEMPMEWARLIQRLQGGGQPAVVPVTDEFCSFCRIQLPTAMVQEIRRCIHIHQCPCCARILYYPEGGGFRMQIDASRFGVGGIARFSSQKLIVPSMKSSSRDEAVHEMVQVLAREGWVDRPDDVLAAAIAREELVSTAVEYGLAFPHVRGVEGVGLVIALGLRKRGLRFGAQGGRLTRIIFFSVIPQAASGFYLKLMAGLVRIFRESDARKRILSHNHEEKVWETFLDLARDVTV